MVSYALHLKTTPQSEKARADQVQNDAGGFVFAMDRWAQLDRFLVLGCEGGSYYAGERAMTLDNAQVAFDCLASNGLRTVARIVDVSVSGRAPKNEPAIFALALAAGLGSEGVRKAALAAVPRVCRTGTHLFAFVRDVRVLRKWGRGLRSAVGRWYNTLSPEKLALQVTKYAQREGWSHRDLLRLAHPTGATPAHDAVFRWVTGGGADALARPSKRGGALAKELLPPLLVGFEALRAAKTAKEVALSIRAFRFTHEMVPSQWKKEPSVWEALLEDMPMTALVRNLGKMTEVGLFTPLGASTRLAVSRLASEARLRGARLHPLSLLGALKVYEQGHGHRGKLQWKPVPALVDALNEAFYLSFSALEPSGKKHLLALDVSGSMTLGCVAGMPGISPRVASAAMAMVTARTEPEWHAVGFSGELVPLGLTAKASLEDTIRTIERVPMGATDCAQPMLYARKHRIPVDTFVVYTDNETWSGATHPFQALREYRQAMGRNAKLIVVGLTATKFSIADPNDAGMLDVVGFDAAAPAVMASFSAA